MIEQSQDVRLAPEARDQLLVPGEVLPQELQGHFPAEFGVQGSIHDTHATFAQLGLKPIVGESLTNSDFSIHWLTLVRTDWPARDRVASQVSRGLPPGQVTWGNLANPDGRQATTPLPFAARHHQGTLAPQSQGASPVPAPTPPVRFP